MFALDHGAIPATIAIPSTHPAPILRNNGIEVMAAEMFAKKHPNRTLRYTLPRYRNESERIPNRPKPTNLKAKSGNSEPSRMPIPQSNLSGVVRPCDADYQHAAAGKCLFQAEKSSR